MQVRVVSYSCLVGVRASDIPLRTYGVQFSTLQFIGGSGLRELLWCCCGVVYIHNRIAYTTRVTKQKTLRDLSLQFVWFWARPVLVTGDENLIDILRWTVRDLGFTSYPSLACMYAPLLAVAAAACKCRPGCWGGWRLMRTALYLFALHFEKYLPTNKPVLKHMEWKFSDWRILGQIQL